MWVRNEGTAARDNSSTGRAIGAAREPQCRGPMRFHIAFVLLAACSSNDTSSTSSNLTGDTHYRDSATDHTGAPQTAAKPAPQTADVTITVKGTATIPNVDARCATDAPGAFEAHYASALDISNTGAYASAMANGTLTTPSGCTIQALSGAVATEIDIHAELDATTENCSTYCAASARADAEASCGASADAASCRTSAEAQAATQCQTTCTQTGHRIAADLTIGAGALGSLDADALRAAAFGDLHGDLAFDHVMQ